MQIIPFLEFWLCSRAAERVQGVLGSENEAMSDMEIFARGSFLAHQ
jgi:hypothetical protein